MRPRSMLPLWLLLALLLLPAPSSAQADANGTADVLPAPAEDGDAADLGAAGAPLASRADISPCDAGAETLCCC